MENTVEEVIVAERPSRAKIFLKSIFWSGLSIFFLLFFTLFKLPDEKIKNYILWQVASNIQQSSRARVSITAEKGHFSLGLGLWYVLEDVTIQISGAPAYSSPVPSPADQPIKIEELSISPHILGIVFRRIGADFQIDHLKSRLSGSFQLSGSKYSFSYKAKNLDLNKLKMIKSFVSIDVSGIVNGSGKIRGDMVDFTQTTGNMDLLAEKILIPQQEIGHLTFFPFTLPEVNVSKLEVEALFEKSRFIVKSFQVGGPASSKEGKTDDIRAKINGEIVLNRDLGSSQMDLKASFMLSERLHKQFFLLDSMVQYFAKSPNGTYGTRLTGTLAMPMPQAIQPEAL
jgi:type II secretion system protein N